ncbi:hypothetical protein [Bacillus smithii]|uniref:Uncharacterized protein n=1 Tax=Bacillus smithii 7_3_47FAA TaxID=665952 RepID=G9QKT0_9BACI|nr:hypothetical protein [Bacillus smithii]EHL78276.1 hypothetical protein HMPREF1015_01769 [Bacillus smithii 7_3_47FAA]
MNQNLWNVLQTLLGKDSIGTTELALARESLSPEVFSALVEYLQDGLKAKGNPWDEYCRKKRDKDFFAKSLVH